MRAVFGPGAGLARMPLAENVRARHPPWQRQSRRRADTSARLLSCLTRPAGRPRLPPCPRSIPASTPRSFAHTHTPNSLDPPPHPTPTTRPGGGLFTSTDPESRRVVPADVGARTKVKIVYVVLEAQYQSALSQAVQAINKKNDKVR